MARTSRLYRLNRVGFHSPRQAASSPVTVVDTGWWEDTGTREGGWQGESKHDICLRESGRELRAGLAEGRGNWALGQKTQGRQPR